MLHTGLLLTSAVEPGSLCEVVESAVAVHVQMRYERRKASQDESM